MCEEIFQCTYGIINKSLGADFFISYRCKDICTAGVCALGMKFRCVLHPERPESDRSEQVLEVVTGLDPALTSKVGQEDFWEGNIILYIMTFFSFLFPLGGWASL